MYRSDSSSLSPSSSTKENTATMNTELIEKMRTTSTSDKLTDSSTTPNDFERICVLGTGAFGTVYQVRRKFDGQVFALKVVQNKEKEKMYTRHLKHEKRVLKSVKSPFICEMYNSFKSEQKTYFLLEFLPGGDFFSLLDAKTKLYEDTCWFYLAETTLALEHLHRRNVIYRDLKAQNVMLDRQGHVKLTDFGLTKTLKNGEKTSTFCGTFDNMAPEVIRGDPYDHTVDLWTLGIFMFDILAGGSPFTRETKEGTANSILACRFPVPELLSKGGVALLKGLLEADSRKRWTIPDVKSSTFFKGIDWKKVAALEYEPPFKPEIRYSHDISSFDREITSQPVHQSPFKAAKSKEDPFTDFNFNEPSTSNRMTERTFPTEH